METQPLIEAAGVLTRADRVINLLSKFADATDEHPLVFRVFEQGELWDDLMDALTDYERNT